MQQFLRNAFYHTILLKKHIMFKGLIILFLLRTTKNAAIYEPTNDTQITYRFNFSYKLSSVPTRGTLKLEISSNKGSEKDPVPLHIVIFGPSLETDKETRFVFDMLTLLRVTQMSKVDMVYPLDKNLVIGAVYDFTFSYVPLGKPVSDAERVFANVNGLSFVSTPEENFDVLEELWFTLGGQKWLTKWEMGSSLCGQFGIVCENENVVEISLASNWLKGTIPNSISQLSFLRKLNLADNKIEGPFPSGVLELKSLERLYLGGNILRGTLEEIENFRENLSRLKNLQVFDVGSNKLSGDMEKIFGKINLKELNISRNFFTGRLLKNVAKEIRNAIILAFGGGNMWECPIPKEEGYLDFDSTAYCNVREETVVNKLN